MDALGDDTVASLAAGARVRRLAGWSGIGMTVAILVNGPISIAAGRMPSFWTVDAADRLSGYLSDDGNITKSIAFFALSNLIFIFALGFFSGLRRLGAEADPSGWVAGVVTIGAALFLAGGLVSEILSTGLAVVLRATPAYTLEVNDALLLQGLWMTALAQGQVALGVLIAVLCLAMLRRRLMQAWVCWFGIVVGIVAILRPAIVTEPPIFMAAFQPVLLWMGVFSVVLLRQACAIRRQ